MTRSAVDAHAREQFFDALDAIGLESGSGEFHDRESGVVDMDGGTIVEALLAAGWDPPVGDQNGLR